MAKKRAVKRKQIIRARQGVITRITPHQGNRTILVPGGKRGLPLTPLP